MTATTAEQIRRQRQAATVLGKLLELAAKQGLPPLAWTVGCAGSSLSGESLAHPHADRRAHLSAWRDAITAASGCAPDWDREHASGHGGVRLLAGWRWLKLGGRPGVNVSLSASIWPDQEEGSDG